MRKFLYWATIACGATAAYLMFRRGESVGTIAQKAVSNPVGALVNELQQAS